MLTKAQIEKLQETIRKRFLRFAVEAVGERAATATELRELKRLGLIRKNVRHLIVDPHLLGRVSALVKREKAKTLTLEKVVSLAYKLKRITPIERKAMEYAQDHAGQYIRGIGEVLSKEVSTSVARRSAEALRRIRKEVKDNIKERSTPSQLKTELFHIVDDKYRDWRRVASTEINDAIQNGIYTEIASKSDAGYDQLVYKRPAPDGCKYCKALYLEDDEITPKIFRLRDLAISNIGKKAKNWKPTIGCFPASALVDGKSIRDIKIGDHVTTHTGALRKVLGKKKEKASRLVVFNKGELTCTPNHNILVFRNDLFVWIQAGDIREGDKLCRRKDSKGFV